MAFRHSTSGVRDAGGAMRDFAMIAPQFWTGDTGRTLRKAGPDGMLVAMYLLTSPHSNVFGLYYMPIMYVAHDLNLPVERAQAAIHQCIDAKFCTYDEEAEVVWVFNMAKFQIGETVKPTDNRAKWIASEWQRLPKCSLLSAFIEKYGHAFGMTEAPCKGGSEAPSKPLTSQEQEQEQEHSKPPSLRDAPLSCSTKQKSITFQTWLLETKAKGEKAVSDYQPVWDYAKLTGIPEDWIEIAWLRFKERYTGEEKAKKKRYIDWRGVFLRAVKENWLGLWFFSEKTKEFCLTTVGVCADIDTREAA